MSDPAIIFYGERAFQALDAASAFMHRGGFSMGAGCAGQPTGALFGDYCIAKWKNLKPSERAAFHAIMTGDRRNGPLTVRLTDQCPPEGREAFLREVSELEGIS